MTTIELTCPGECYNEPSASCTSPPVRGGTKVQMTRIRVMARNLFTERDGALVTEEFEFLS